MPRQREGSIPCKVLILTRLARYRRRAESGSNWIRSIQQIFEVRTSYPCARVCPTQQFREGFTNVRFPRHASSGQREQPDGSQREVAALKSGQMCRARIAPVPEQVPGQFSFSNCNRLTLPALAAGIADAASITAISTTAGQTIAAGLRPPGV